jgi:hypothetical protein
MDRTDVAYVINTTPKYFYILELHLRMLSRYAQNMKWPVFLATEAPNKSQIINVREAFPNLKIIPLTQSQEAFLESRLAAVEALPADIQYVFPIQEDFLLQGRPREDIIAEAIGILDESPSVSSLRLMPSPGPLGKEKYGETEWTILDYGLDSLVFTYQATLWRREAYVAFMRQMLEEIREKFGVLSHKQKIDIQIKLNVCETDMGKEVLRRVTGLHLAWPREGRQPNAVLLCPWPYRPTAVELGRLQNWALEIAEREEVFLDILP